MSWLLLTIVLVLLPERVPAPPSDRRSTSDVCCAQFNSERTSNRVVVLDCIKRRCPGR